MGIWNVWTFQKQLDLDARRLKSALQTIATTGRTPAGLVAGHAFLHSEEALKSNELVQVVGASQAEAKLPLSGRYDAPRADAKRGLPRQHSRWTSPSGTGWPVVSGRL
ncbi:hypothetical protein CSOJ01_08140 [Colletotrichum sojae]|uniref:Uncharacterized protein n=1 Tax=Colletotrichum sojae TaxID=2175907 RepID=A0A8H6J6X2_9PEZI|nr:hypothetical protein CSOJ01_08140 [Colletotrichum sojae]